MNLTSIVVGDQRADLLRTETLADIFRETVHKYGNRTALVFKDQSVTYQELDHWSNQVAVYLNGNGIKPGSFVGVWYKRGLELHVAILGIIKAGAAYVPIDREMPAERVETVLEEVKASGCFSLDPLNIECPLFEVPPFENILIPNDMTPIGPAPENCAYVLYTSGSTGKPKGIPINHRQICHLIRAEQSVFEIEPEDRVYQGFSVSFDMWCEETWITYLVGAQLWVADNTTAKSIDELSDVLNEQNITVLHAVPSLLAVIDNVIPSLRIINAGGEACSPQVLERWAQPGRRFFNSYGPTETTVSASIAQLQPGDAITIGKPLPNYGMAVVDEKLNLLPPGEQGELVISGVGVSHGYVNLPHLTSEKFIHKPSFLHDLPGDRIYRTGDAATVTADGSIELSGRLDDQIKLRGYRIELGEIESKLNAYDGVAAAAVAVKKDSSGQEQLVGYVVMKEMLCINESEMRAELAKTLPSYMVPAGIVMLQEMPRMPSGKINRKALPVPEWLKQETISESEGALDLNAPVSARMLAILHKMFPGRTIDLSMDFFNDLGGHSLLAAAFVSRLRRDASIPKASLRDVYLNRPLNVLAQAWENEQAETKTAHVFNKVDRLQYITCWIAQSIALLMVYALFAIQIFIPYLGYYYMEQDTGSLLYAILTAIGMFCFIPPFFTVVSIASKWLIIGKMKEGDYPLWGEYYFRWWLVRTMQNLFPVQFLNGTPLYPVYLRLMGANVADTAQLSSLSIGAEDLITIGDDASLSSQVMLNNAVVEDGLLKLRSIKIGAHAYIGSSAVIAGDCEMEDWTELQDLSFLPQGSKVKEGQVWQGSPARLKETKQLSDLPQPLVVSKQRMRKYKFIFMLSAFVFPFVILIPIIPTIITLNKLDNAAPDYNFNYLVIVPFLATTYILLYAAETILLSRVLQRGIKPGKYPIYSLFYVRKWFADQLMSLSLIVMHPIFATVYVGRFFRALGAKVGKNAEVSTASSVTHPLLSIGNNAFVADAVTLGEADVRGQQLILDNTVICDNSFVGNSALIPQGYELPSRMLIGVLSTPPDKEQLSQSNAKDWFGSPAIGMPYRQPSNAFANELVLNPGKRRKMARAIVEFVRIILPESAIIIFSTLFIAYAHDLLVDLPTWKVIMYLPFYYLGFMGIPAFLLTVLLKWIFVGKYKPQQVPMWTWKVWRSEAITSTYEALAVPFLLEYLKGTPWLPLLLRLLGLKTCKRVWLNTTDFTEFDMVSIGDDTALNDDCGPQTHLFEDRIMKIGPVKIGARSSIGARSIILYDSETGNDSHIEALSLVMKGERLSPGSSWIGSPVKPM